MAKQLTYEKIKNYINDEVTGKGCKLSMTKEEFDFEKIIQNKNNSHVKLNILCKCGNDFSSSFDNFKRTKKQCNKCSGLERLSIGYIKHFVEVESKSNCKLISTEYINARQLLEFKCSCGKPFKKSWNKFYSANQRMCNECSDKLLIEKLKLPYEEIKYFIEIESKSNCKLITTQDKYIDVNTDINIRCKCGNSFTTTFHNFKSKQLKKRQCDKCGEKIRRENLSLPYEVVKDFINNKSNSGCKLLTSKIKYQNSSTLLNIQCKCGNTFSTTYHVFKREVGNKRQCDDCSNKQKIQLCLQKYGVENPLQNKEIYWKSRQSLYNNGTAPRSKQQIFVWGIIGGILNYPHYNASLDIAYPEEKVYVECDFSGHWLAIKLGTMTENEFEQIQRRRWYSLYRSGWKEIRIISRKDYIPSDSKLLEMMVYANEYLNSGHHYIKFDIDNSKIISSQGEFEYNFGKLRKIKSIDLQEAI